MMEEKRGRTEEREKECRKNRKWRRRGRVKEELHRRKGRKTIFGRRGKVKRRTEVERKKENRKRGKKERERRARGRGKGGGGEGPAEVKRRRSFISGSDRETGIKFLLFQTFFLSWMRMTLKKKEKEREMRSKTKSE